MTHDIQYIYKYVSFKGTAVLKFLITYLTKILIKKKINLFYLHAFSIEK